MSAEPLAPEDQARADFYALLAQLFYAPPERELLDRLAAAGEIGGEAAESSLANDWRELRRAASGVDAEAVREEYEATFIGTGRAEVSLYAGAHASPSGLDNPLVSIRGFLAAQGLERRQAVNEPEDHIAALCEVMRHLVVRGDAAAQRDFFTGYLASAGPGLCDAIIDHPRAEFYGHAARFAKKFLALEHAAFDME